MLDVSFIYIYISLCTCSKQQLWKESLNSDHQQYHQYQQNEQSPLAATHWTQKRGGTTYVVGNPGPGLEHALKCVIKEWCIYKCVAISPLVIHHAYVALP